MSRIGKVPVEIPGSVTVGIVGSEVSVKGPKGSLSMTVNDSVVAKLDDGAVVVTCKSEDRKSRSLQGLSRTLIANMVTGVSQGFSKSLEVKGVGYRVGLKGQTLDLALGFSHPVTFTLPKAVSARIEDKTKIVLESVDRQLLGQVASELRSLRPPEPYGGKGVRYSEEHVRRKEGKSGAK